MSWLLEYTLTIIKIVFVQGGVSTSTAPTNADDSDDAEDLFNAEMDAHKMQYYSEKLTRHGVPPFPELTVEGQPDDPDETTVSGKATSLSLSLSLSLSVSLCLSLSLSVSLSLSLSHTLCVCVCVCVCCAFWRTISYPHTDTDTHTLGETT